ncbi:thioredoxin family protein [Halomicronema hongdechloris C2206]|uniref:Thioredoxin family protein n=1 Tax=Halomicronema hongdechloris C2206 TaxID=1641165 RepID=A0A1Z3HR52_9CYAN|nr:thioredoxin family protein [Halomicronema hongdechloris]ASC72617.1 thioredoxin family protein [Halomicronema hongdechloris C2206]
MAMVESTMLELGTPAPAFALPDVVSGQTITLDDVAKDKAALLVMFICQHCPFVQHVKQELARFGHDYGDRVGIVAISANNVDTHPQDAPDYLKAMAESLGFTFPFCYDESQAVAKAYTAACTPDFFLFDGNRRLVYRGQLDDSRPSNGVPVTGKDLRAALETTLKGETVPAVQKPSVGCNIKWKPGNEPPYFG